MADKNPVIIIVSGDTGVKIFAIRVSFLGAFCVCAKHQRAF